MQSSIEKPLELPKTRAQLLEELCHLETEILAEDRVEFSRALGFEPEPWQSDLLTTKSNRIILNCSRQVGKSTFAAMVALHTALFQPKSLVLIFAPSLRQSQEFFRKVDEHWCAMGMTHAESERKLGLELPNGSRIEALPGTEKTTKGFSAPRLIILDEASRIEDELYYEGVRPMFATVPESTFMLLSTPYGKRGFFYKIWTEGIGWKRIQITADQSRAISQAYIEEERQEKTRRQILQEYYCAFLDTDEAVFATEDIDAAFAAKVEAFTTESVFG